MPKWRHNNSEDDKYFKYDKIRRAKDKRKKQQGEAEGFILTEELWDKSKPGWFRARVVEVQKRYAFVAPQDDNGKIDTKDVWLGTVARKYLQSRRKERNSVAVGDVVSCRPTGRLDADIDTDIPCCVISNAAPRQSEISRQDPASPDRRHILASNINQLLIVASYQAPLVKWGLIDRYLVLAEEQNIEPIIIINKSDLLANETLEFRKRCEEEIEVYRKLGYKVFSLSLLNKPDAPEIKEIESLLKDRTTILSGHSGVGKSSLVNLFRPEIVQEVEPDSDIFYKGRHTTTYASFIALDTGGFVIDTPGIRSFLIGERSPTQLSFLFREMKDLVGSCKYRECRHIDEPDCAILDALHKGQITNRRYQSFKGLLLGETGREGRTRDDEQDIT